MVSSDARLPSGEAVRGDRAGDRFCLEEAEAEETEELESPASAFRITDLLSSRNISDS